MENKNNGSATTGPSTPAMQDADVSSTTVRTRISAPASGAPRPGTREADEEELDRLARRYSREAQLALEGLLYWGLRWPFELMATLVESGRKWEEEYYRPGPRRRVSRYNDESR